MLRPLSWLSPMELHLMQLLLEPEVPKVVVLQRLPIPV